MAQAIEPTTQDLFDAIEVIPEPDKRPFRIATRRAQANRKAYHDITRFLGIRQATCDTHGLVY
jgi:hypothetical protein